MIDEKDFLYMPRGVQTESSIVQLSLKDFRVISDEVRSKEDELAQLRQQVESLTATNSQMTQELTSAINERDNAMQQAAAANQQVQNLAAEITDKAQQIERLTEQLKQARENTKPDKPDPEPDTRPEPDDDEPDDDFDPDLPEFATYVVDSAGSGPKRTATMKGNVDELRVAGAKEIVFFVNEEEILEGDLPEYFESGDIWFWSDTFMAVYRNCQRRTAESKKTKKPRDWWADVMNKITEFPTHRGFVLDDVNKESGHDFAEVVEAIRAYSDKPIVATFAADTDLTQYLPTIRKFNVKVARQFLRLELEKDPKNDTLEERTGVITRWLSQPNYLCDVVNLEHYRDGQNVTDAADLREMYNRCIRAGKKSFMTYAAVDTNGFKIWQDKELWDAFQDILDAYPHEVAAA